MNFTEKVSIFSTIAGALLFVMGIHFFNLVPNSIISRDVTIIIGLLLFIYGSLSLKIEEVKEK